jgi:hypothetical protein
MVRIPGKEVPNLGSEYTSKCFGIVHGITEHGKSQYRAYLSTWNISPAQNKKRFIS